MPISVPSVPLPMAGEPSTRLKLDCTILSIVFQLLSTDVNDGFLLLKLFAPITLSVPPTKLSLVS